MINCFRGDYNFLSNFSYFDNPLIYGRLSFRTNEHFYIAMKTKDVGERLRVATHPLKGLKGFGKTLSVRSDWDIIKRDVMLYGITYKFSRNNPLLRSKLIKTHPKYIQEGNYWNDKFWGVCLKTGEGDNNLGKIIMYVRNNIIKEENTQ